MSRPGNGPRLRLIKPKGFQVAIWYVYWTEGGQTRRRSTGSASRDEAERFFEAFLRTVPVLATPKPPQRRRLSETEVIAVLHAELGGFREVQTPIGRIDLLTSTEVIEVKEARFWREAVGQVLAYGHFFPDRRPRLHLFGTWPQVHATVCRAICGDRIRVTRHSSVENGEKMHHHPDGIASASQ